MSPVSKAIKLNSGFLMPTIGFGTWEMPCPVTAKNVEDALNVGYRHVDTAKLYYNEKEVGEGVANWIKSSPQNKREDVFYTTKLWQDDFTYDLAKAAIDEAFGKVKQLGYIDLILMHSPCCSPSDRLGTWKALQEAVDAGIVRSIGVSNWGIRHIKELLAWDGLKIKPAVNQVETHPWCMRTELCDFCADNEIQICSFSPLTHGMYLNRPELVELAKKYGKSPAQILIRWNLQKGRIPLPKSSSVKRMKENLDVYDFEISDGDMRIIEHPEVHEPTDWEVTDWP